MQIPSSSARAVSRWTFVALLTLALLPLAARAEVKLPHIIGDNMMLQQEKPVPIWGWASPDEKVTVKFGDQAQGATADKDGKWIVKLDPLKAGATGEMTIAGSNTITLKNVLVGEVWACSGQSNMEFGMRGAHNASVEIPKANYPKIRLFTVKKKIAFEPQTDCDGAWEECTPETVGGFTAVGYFFGRDIYQALDVPVGLIHTSWGGTPAQAWTSLEKLKSVPEFGDLVTSFETTAKNMPELKETYEKETLPKWQEADKKWKAAKAAGEPAGSKPEPRRPNPPDLNPNLPSVLFNGMIAPIVPYAIRGATWYQGESNAGNPLQYRVLFPAMITDWREHWGEGDFTFLFVQLANFMARTATPTQESGGWPGLREAQSMTLSLPNTGMAVIIDIGQADNIHPKDKMDVGYRLALAAEHVAYGKDLVFSGPMYDSMSVEGDKVRVKFKSVGSGLAIAAPPSTQMSVEPESPASQLKGFSIAGEDHKFIWANAIFDGDSVVVSSDEVKDPKAVRYGWANNPSVNLYNREGLPASPFRTDNWGDPPKK